MSTTPKKVLYLIRGVPGSGKSTYAKSLNIPDHYEADMWFEQHGGFVAAKLKDAHNWCYGMAVAAMRAGRPVVVSNTFTRLWEMQPYIVAAEELGYEVKQIIMRGEYKNIHSCPDETVKRMRDRFEYPDNSVYA